MMIYVLVFIAVFVAIVYAIRLTQVIGMEKAELEKSHLEGNQSVNQMGRFISEARLLQLRIMFLTVSGGLMAGILIFAEVPLFICLGVAAIFGSLGFFLPFWYYKFRLMQRKKAFEGGILDLTMGLANGLRAGQGLPQSLESIVSRLEGPIREEMAVVLREYRLGIELSESFERLYSRMPCEDLRLLVTSIRLTTQSGGSLADVLAKMTEMIRSRTEFQEKLRTLTAQGRFEAIAIACAPVAAFVILYFMDRDLMAPMLTSSVGWLAFGVVAILETIGFLIINKIVTIEV